MFKKSLFIMITVLLVIISSSIVLAQAVPTMPALCYGELRINNSPAPVGTTVVAKVDGQSRGQLVSENPGWYGGPGIESKLSVSGSGLTGKTVRFYVSGSFEGKTFSDVYGGEAPYWGSGEVEQINLAIQVSGTTPGPQPDPGTGTQPGTGAGSGSAVETVKAPAPDPVTGIVFGDINADGVINVRDVALVMQHVLSIKELSASQKEAADVNKDDVIDVRDINLILKFSLGLINSFN